MRNHSNNEMKVTIKVKDLIKHLNKNKEQHIKDFASAKKIYLKKVIEHLETSLVKAKEGKLIKGEYKHNMHQPVDKSAEYDKYIGMFEMATEEEMTISVEDYDNFVNDEWHWVSQSKTINAMYNTV